MGSWLSNFGHDMRVYWLSLRVQLRAAAMLRGAFVTQVVGMMLNNTFVLGAWLLFFHYFGTINGWSGVDFIGISGVQMLIYGLLLLTMMGLADMGRHVDTGSLDSFLTKPTSVLGSIASSRVDVTTFGDILMGIGLISWYAVHIDASLLSLLLFAVAMVSAAVIFFCFAQLLPSILAFYFFDSEQISRYASMLFLDVGLYPSAVLSGGLRLFFLTAVPAILYAAMPVSILRGLQTEWVLIGAGVAAFWLSVSLWLFRRAIRRYESANLVGAR